MLWEFGGVLDGFCVFVQWLVLCVVLIFGCGSVQEVGWFVQVGWLVWVIDFVVQVVVVVKVQFGVYVDVVEQVDFFQYWLLFDVQWVYECVFLCVLLLSLCVDYVVWMVELLFVGGLLVGYFFVVVKLKGLLFGIECVEFDVLFVLYFELVEDLFVIDLLVVFDGYECWFMWCCC